MIFSPSDFSLSTKLSISLPLAPSFSALPEPLGLKVTHAHVKLLLMCLPKKEKHCYVVRSSTLYTYLTDTGADLGFSGSITESVMMVAGLLIPELPKPPKPGAFLPARSASRLACCSSLAFRLISALASRSWVW